MLLTDHLVPVRLWTAAALSSTGTLTSDPLFVGRLKRLESIMFKLTVGAGDPDIKIEWLLGDDQGNYSSAVTLSSSTAADFSGSPSGENVLALSAPLALNVKIKLTELASKATTVTMVLIGRE